MRSRLLPLDKVILGVRSYDSEALSTPQAEPKLGKTLLSC